MAYIYNIDNIAKNSKVMQMEQSKAMRFYRKARSRSIRGKGRRRTKKGGTVKLSPYSAAATKVKSIARGNKTRRYLKLLELYRKLPDEIQGYIDKNTDSVNFARNTFFKAIVSGNIKMIKFLIDKVDINVKDKYLKITPLIAALLNPNTIKENNLHNIIKLLLLKGADIKDTDTDDGNTVLHLVNNNETAKLLIKYGANINALNHEGETPLFHAYNVKVAELLINKGANVNALNYEGETPIFGLIKYNNSLDSVKLLIKKHNVLTGKPNNYGSTLLHKLANDPRLNYKLQLTKYLITVGIDKYGPKILHIENKNKDTPYSIFENNNLEILEYIKRLTVTRQIYKKPISKTSNKSSNISSNRSSNSSSNRSSNRSTNRYSNW